MKTLGAFFITLILFVTILPVAFAQTTQRPLTDKVRNGTPSAAQKQTIQESKIGPLQERAKLEIARRLESLQKLLTRITEFKKLSTSQKATLTSGVQAQITALTALQTKIAADTDTATLKTDIQSIVQSYRIYALFIPQIQILGAADRLLTVADEMTTHASSLEAKIADAKTNGKEVTDLEALLSDMQTKIADAKTQAQNALDTVTPLQPEGFPDNKTTLQSARQMVETAYKDLTTARDDARKIITGLLKLGIDLKPSISITPVISCVPRPKCSDVEPNCKVALTEKMCPQTPIPGVKYKITPTTTPAVSPTQ